MLFISIIVSAILVIMLFSFVMLDLSSENKLKLTHAEEESFELKN